MVDLQRVQSLIRDYVDFYHRPMIRSWTSFVNKPMFIRGGSVRSLSVDQLRADFQRDIGYFKISIKGDVNGDMFWFFEYKFLLFLSSLMLMQDSPSGDYHQELDDKAIKALEVLAHHGGLAMVRGQENVMGLNLELGSCTVHFLEEDELSELNSVIPEGLCRVVQSHLEVFGHDPSVIITVFPDNLSLQFGENAQMVNWYKELHRIEENLLMRTNVLVADSVTTYRNIIINMLGKYKVHVIEVESGMEAVKTLDEQEVSMVFYDIEMPDMDGFRFGSWLRERSDNRSCPLILCGKEASSAVLTAAKKTGMSDFLVRPAKPKTMKQILEKFIPEIVRDR